MVTRVHSSRSEQRNQTNPSENLHVTVTSGGGDDHSETNRKQEPNSEIDRLKGITSNFLDKFSDLAPDMLTEEISELKKQIHDKNLFENTASRLDSLLKYIKTLPGSVIYNHTHQFLQQHIYLSPEPPNDFAYWVREFLNEAGLAEKLNSIDTCEFIKIRQLRNALIRTIESHLARSKRPVVDVPEGAEFNFIKAYSFVIPTPYAANTLKEFLEALNNISIHSIYFHMFEARLRLEKGTNDFSFWLGTSLSEVELAEEISRLDPYTYTLEDLRRELANKVKRHIR